MLGNLLAHTPNFNTVGARCFPNSQYYIMSTPQPSSSLQMSAMAQMTQIWVFPKLKGQENYQSWARKMQSALMFSNLWDIVEQGIDMRSAELPTDPAPTAAATRIYEAAYKSWKEVNNQAAALIYSMCEDKPAEGIEEERVAQLRWEKLQKTYKSSGFVLRYSKLEELMTTSLESSGGSIETYVANILGLSKDLRLMGSKIDDWILTSMLLHNLGTKYKDFVHRLLTQLSELPDFDRIVALLHEESRL